MNKLFLLSLLTLSLLSGCGTELGDGPVSSHSPDNSDAIRSNSLQASIANPQVTKVIDTYLDDKNQFCKLVVFEYTLENAGTLLLKDVQLSSQIKMHINTSSHTTSISKLLLQSNEKALIRNEAAICDNSEGNVEVEFCVQSNSFGEDGEFLINECQNLSLDIYSDSDDRTCAYNNETGQTTCNSNGDNQDLCMKGDWSFAGQGTWAGFCAKTSRLE